MFQLRDQVRQQRVMNLTRGFLSFYDCMVKIDDVQALVDHVASCARKGFLLRHMTFEFCRFHDDDGTLEALQDFFRHTATAIESISFVKNHLSNADIARVLDGAHNKELMIILPGGNASYLHRHLILSSQCHVENLNLDFKGAVNYADLDEDMVAAICKLQRLEKMRLDGWTMTDETFAQLITGIRCNATLKSLHLGRIRGLTTASSSELVKLGTYLPQLVLVSSQDNTNNSQSSSSLSRQGLEELHISMIPSLFVVTNNNNGRDANHNGDPNAIRRSISHQAEQEDGLSDTRYTVETFEELFRNMSIRHVSIQESRVHPKVVCAIFRGLAQSSDSPKQGDQNQQQQQVQQQRQSQAQQRRRSDTGAGIAVFCLKAWNFTDAEFQQLLTSLPKMRLSKLDVSQGGINFATQEELIIKALRPNLCLRELDLSYRGDTLNAASHATLGSLLKRNCNLKMVRNVLEYYPSGRMDILDKLAITQLLAEEADQTKKNKNGDPKNKGVAALDALYLLLNHRILESALS
ncbi:hypothetical protein ACA910_020129 [Epithemia clementina (nom. ined.)]